MASIRSSENSPFYLADVRLWVKADSHPEGGFFKKTTKSTKVRLSEPESKALKVAEEMEEISREARLTALPPKTFFESRVSSLMRAAGVEPPVKTSNWVDFSAQYLAAKDVGESTMVKYSGEVAQFSDFLGARRLHDLRSITTDDLETFHKGLMTEGRTKGTARNTCKTVKAVFQLAKDTGFVELNPAATLKLKNNTDAPKRLPYTREDMATVFAYLEANNLKEWRTSCLFGLYYGMRIGDATSRQGEEIRVENGIKVIRFVPEKKKRSGQEIALPLVGELLDLTTKGPITPNLEKYGNPTRAYLLITKKAGIEVRYRKKTGKKGKAIGDKSFHSWRHTANSLLADAGVDKKVRQLICDHDDERQNLKYTHASVESMSSAIAKATKGIV